MKRPSRLQSPPSKRQCEDGCARLSKAVPLCEYQNCGRPRWEKAPGMYHQFCGIMHHDFHMTELHAELHGQIPELCTVRDGGLGRDKKCRLPKCDKPVYVDATRIHDFCGKTHMLQYITLSTNQFYKLGKICKIKDCYRLAYVEDGKPHDYCGLRHAKLAAAAKGAGGEVHKKEDRQPEGTGEEINSNSDQDQDSGWVQVQKGMDVPPENEENQQYRLPPKDEFGHSGFDGLIPDHQLRDYLKAAQAILLDDCLHGRTSDLSQNKINVFQGEGSKFHQTNIFQGADISKFHPWEVVTESKPRYLLTITSKTKVSRQTRDGRCWKQTGPPYTKLSGLHCKYFGYKATNSKRGTVTRKQKTSKDSWTLHEYFLADDVLTELAEQRGISLGKGGALTPRRPVIMKIFRGDNSEHGVGDEQTAPCSDMKFTSAITRENSICMESAVSEQIRSDDAPVCSSHWEMGGEWEATMTPEDYCHIEVSDISAQPQGLILSPGVDMTNIYCAHHYEEVTNLWLHPNYSIS